MKKIKIILWLLIGGVILMTVASLNGCSLGGETIPKNRTKEEYEFEKTFEPMFKFLEQEKKDFTGLEAYQSSVYIKTGDDVKNYEVDLDTTQSDIKGDYTITIGDNEETVPVTYSNGKLNYSLEISPLFDEEILVDDEELHSRKLRQKASWLPILYYLLISFAILGFVIYIVYFYGFTASVK